MAARRRASVPKPKRRAPLVRVRSLADLRRSVARLRARGERVAFVPTMGAQRVVVSIFVNPLQFGPKEDFSRYPRPAARDRALLAAEGVDLLWEPQVADVYPSGDRTRVFVEGLSDVLEGSSRPGHFTGVCTVVARLLNAVLPDDLWLGQKDAQQAIILERMASDLLMPVRILRGPTVREEDGLAMSSRNAYLSHAERQQAVALSQGLAAAWILLKSGERNAQRLASAIRREWDGYPLVREDYIAIVDPVTLEPLKQVRGPALVAVAAHVGPARLIDNFPWSPR
ncbi:MAG: pantoate--beta-alanine ligase [Candidatus Eisenbacteria bacterium]